MKKTFVLILTLVLCSTAWAQVTLPNTFTSGTTISASQVNANFNVLLDAINTLQTTVTNQAATITALQAKVGRVAVLSETLASGGTSQSPVAGAYQTRNLNTIDDPTSVVTLLSANRFTLPAGTYLIEANSPVHRGDLSKAKIRNITDSTDAIIGQSSYVAYTAAVSGNCDVVGLITISSSKVFELQQRVTNTVGVATLGNWTTFGDSEVFSLVKITKL